jgi:hypothetical protein
MAQKVSFDWMEARPSVTYLLAVPRTQSYEFLKGCL